MNDTKSRPAGRISQRRPGGRTRDRSDQILTAAAKILETGGYAALNFLDVAASAGVGRSTLYRRWPSKAELTLDVMERALGSEIKPADTGSLHGDLTESLRQIGRLIASPLGQAAIAASIEMERIQDATALRQQLWDKRLASFMPLFDRAKKRNEVHAEFDANIALALMSGALLYRNLLMARPVNQDWINRIVKLVTSAGKA